MSEEITLEFEKNDSGTETGLRIGQVETFAKNAYAKCAREITQNSLDAKAKNKEEPVKITFEKLSIPTNEIPFINELRSVLSQCKDANANDSHFFNQAIAIAEKDQIKVLKISDYNTTGLKGPPSDRDSPFFALLKATGLSSKESETAGGSFGIGKWAPFALSDLRTVIYSTKYQNHSDEISFAAQGRCQLRSHENSEGQKFNATGFWGRKNYKAIEEEASVPEWLNREEVGTSIYIFGFNDLEEWEKRIRLAAVTNFFKAIYDGELEFSIGSSGVLNKNNLRNCLLHEEELEEIAKLAGLQDDLKLSRLLFCCLDNQGQIKKNFSDPKFGKFELIMEVAEELPKRVGFLRNGMYICKQLGGSFESTLLARFPRVKEFIALLYPVNDQAKSLMRKAENPAHNELEVDYVYSLEEKKAVKAAFNKLSKLVMAFIRETAELEISSERDITELAEFFPNHDGNDSNGANETEPHPEEIVITSRPKRKRPPVVFDEPGDIEVDDELPDDPGDDYVDPKPRPHLPPGPDDVNPSSRKKSVKIVPHRNKFVGLNNYKKRVLYFDAPYSGSAILHIFVSGMEKAAKIPVVESSRGEVSDGSIKLLIAEEERTGLTVTFDRDFAKDLILQIESADFSNLEQS